MDSLMHNSMILYRGSLKSCNYHCSYCPFSKHPASEREIVRERKQWEEFCRFLCRTVPKLGLCGCMVVPYGEVLLYPWYWNGLAKISRIEQIEAVGAQTNLSFSLQMAEEVFAQEEGRREKLRLWATFHPEMISAEEFSEKCRRVFDAGISLCAGAVGVPENLLLLRELRRKLPKEIYLWINKMDGLGRQYTEEEVKNFAEIDPFFYRELSLICADSRECRNRIFAEGNGKHHTCNISAVLPDRWNEGEGKFPEPKCSRKVCSCYLAYGGRDHFMNHLLFGSYPLFRIPCHFRAAFFDIDGTLIQEKRIPELTIASLKALAKKGVYLFFATSLPILEAKKRCTAVWDLFCGGIFSGGAHVVFSGRGKENHKEIHFPLCADILPLLKEKERDFHFHLLADEKKGQTDKITLVRPRKLPWKKEEGELLLRFLPQKLRKTARCFLEGHCLEFVSIQANKENGVKMLCEWLGISPSEAAAAGNGEEDKQMLNLCKISVDLTYNSTKDRQKRPIS